MRIFITGIGGLIGSTVAEVANKIGHVVKGCDSNDRGRWFGKQGSITWRMKELLDQGVIAEEGDFREMLKMSQEADLIVHCAAQPSHDLSRGWVLEDSSTNYYGTVQLLEYTRTYNSGAVFILMSTNKVYGDRINNSKFTPGYKRFLYADKTPGVTEYGVNEYFPIDQSLHTPFGVSKLAADLMTQEYRHCFNLRTVVFRCGCLTGKAGSAVEMQGFLGYLVKCAVSGEPYTIYGHEGLQVRDNIDAADVASAVLAYADNPRDSVYNMGGGPSNAVSILEAIDYLKARHDAHFEVKYGPERLGDHLWWISDTRKFQRHYPEWKRKSVWEVLDEMVRCERNRREPKEPDPTIFTGPDPKTGVFVEPGGAPVERPSAEDAGRRMLP
jgi:CDP-paratose 2-epimerase